MKEIDGTTSQDIFTILNIGEHIHLVSFPDCIEGNMWSGNETREYMYVKTTCFNRLHILPSPFSN